MFINLSCKGERSDDYKNCLKYISIIQNIYIYKQQYFSLFQGCIVFRYNYKHRIKINVTITIYASLNYSKIKLKEKKNSMNQTKKYCSTQGLFNLAYK